jgi:hypothetical protein
LCLLLLLLLAQRPVGRVEEAVVDGQAHLFLGQEPAVLCAQGGFLGGVGLGDRERKGREWLSERGGRAPSLSIPARRELAAPTIPPSHPSRQEFDPATHTPAEPHHQGRAGRGRRGCSASKRTRWESASVLCHSA